MASFGQKRRFVKLENKRQRLDVVEDGTWSIPLMTAGLGRRGAPTLASLYKPKNSQHKLARAQLFEQAAVDCRKKYPTRGKQMHVRQAFDFIRDWTLKADLPQDILHGLFEEQRKRFIRDAAVLVPDPDSGELQFSEEFLMAYINSLEAAVLALETERAIAMFAEGEQVTVDSLTLKMYFPFSDAMEQQDLIDKGVQKQNRVIFGAFRFFKSLPIPVVRRLLEFTEKLRLYGKRKLQRINDPFYSAKVFRRTLNQANSWFFAEVDRASSLVKNRANDEEERRRRYNPPDWSFYEKNAMSRALTKRDAKEERDFILQTKEKMVGWGGYRLDDFFMVFWELQERERQLSIIIEVEAWVKRRSRFGER